MGVVGRGRGGGGGGRRWGGGQSPGSHVLSSSQSGMACTARPGTRTCARRFPERAATSASCWRRWGVPGASGEHLDISSPRLTVLGLRPEPQQAATPPEKARHKTTEPAWRLLHAVTLLQIYKARTRVHMAHHADHGPHDAKRATPKHILRAVKQRVAARVQYEHDRALHASREQPKPSTHKSAWAKFHSHWIATGIAGIRKGGPRLNLLSPPPPAQPLPARAVHIRVTATLHPARGKQPPKAAWAIAVEDLDEAGRATARMEAAAAIATEATHGPNHPACQATRHTWQVAHQVAVAKGLRSAAQHRRRGRPIVLTVHNSRSPSMAASAVHCRISTLYTLST